MEPNLYQICEWIRLIIVKKTTAEKVAKDVGITKTELFEYINWALIDKLTVRYDTEVIEWNCKHGVGHPVLPFNKKDKSWGTHACEGCCGLKDFPRMHDKNKKGEEK